MLLSVVRCGFCGGLVDFLATRRTGAEEEGEISVETVLAAFSSMIIAESTGASFSLCFPSVLTSAALFVLASTLNLWSTFEA